MHEYNALERDLLCLKWMLVDVGTSDFSFILKNPPFVTDRFPVVKKGSLFSVCLEN